MFKISTSVLLGVVALSAGTANAATRTVCFNLTFREGRDTSNSPSDTELGNKRGRHADNTATPAVGHLYELWDKDFETDDDFIGTFIKTVDGRGCVTFEWEGLGFTENNPDVYVKYINEVRNTALAGDKVRAVDEAQDPYPLISWRNGNDVDEDAFVAMDCTNGSNCEIVPNGSLAITTEISSTRSDRVLNLDTAQRALQTFNAEFNGTNDGVIDLLFPCVPGTTPGIGANETCPGGGYTDNRELIVINNSPTAVNGRSAAHELGHLLMMTEFGRDTLAFDYSLNGSSWSRTSAEFESAAVMEAWADFASVASWWNDDDDDSDPRVASLDVEPATPFITSSCSANSGLEIQSVKGFWDLVDSNNEGASAPSVHADTFNTSPRALSDGWDRFPSGVGNRDDNEPGGIGNDPDGRNLRDYFANNDAFFGTGFFTTLMNHNCTGDQDDN